MEIITHFGLWVRITLPKPTYLTCHSSTKIYNFFCNQRYFMQKVIAKIGLLLHTWSLGTCSVCGIMFTVNIVIPYNEVAILHGTPVYQMQNAGKMKCTGRNWLQHTFLLVYIRYIQQLLIMLIILERFVSQRYWNIPYISITWT